MSKLIRVTGAVLLRDATILAALRGPGKSMAGHWEFPGGKVEQAETPRECLKRELREELLIDAAVGDEVTTTVYAYDFATIELTTFWCEIVAGHPKLTEHSEVRWVTAAEMAELKWAPADVPAARIVRDALDRVN